MSAGDLNRERATLVLSGGDGEVLDWAAAEANDSRVITVWNMNLLRDSLHLAQSHVDVEVVRVIFDQSIDAQDWLEFLSALPSGFRGDVLFVVSPGKAFLSAVGRADERVMYRLGGLDIQFYLKTAGIEAVPSLQPPVPSVDHEIVLPVAV